MINTASRLVIVDPSLLDERGHHYSLTRNISTAAVKLGIEVIWFTHRNFDQSLKPEHIKLQPVFSSTLYGQYASRTLKQPYLYGVRARLPRMLREFLGKVRFKLKRLCPDFIFRLKKIIFKELPNAEDFIDEFDNALQLEKIGPDDHVLIHTAYGDIYRAILNLMMKPGYIDSPPNFHLCTPYDDKIMPKWNTGYTVDRVIEYMKFLDLVENNVFLYGENKLLAGYLGSLWDVNVDTLQIPPPDIAICTNAKKEDFINVVYLGPARVEKGFLMLPDLVESICGKESEKYKLRFTIQCNPQIIGYLPEIKKAIHKLRKYSDKYVTLIEDNLSTDEYYSVLDNADVILLCYDREKYKIRSSGIAIEAVSMGKVVVTTPDTFPAMIAGDTAVLVNDTAEAKTALKMIMDNFDQLKGKAVTYSHEYRQQNSAESYVKRIISRKTIINLEQNKDYEKSKNSQVINESIDNLLSTIREAGINGSEPRLKRLL